MRTAPILSFLLGTAALVAVLLFEHPWDSARPVTELPLPRLSCDLPEDKDSRHPGMVWVPPGAFDMGDTVYREEGPMQRTLVQGFWMDRTEVSNAEFARFVAATAYVTVAERPVDTVRHPDLQGPLRQAGAVVFVIPEQVRNDVDIRQWWTYRPGANWRHPGGPGTTIEGREALPVVAVTYEDAQAYARWKGRELPSEAQWEWAARGGEPVHSGQLHPPLQANTWQGVFPVNNQAQDGFVGVAPVGCFAPNRYGLYDMIGNVWEITRDPYVPFHDARDTPPPDQEVMPTRPGQALGQHVIKGGSFLCAPNYCMRYRPGARQGQEDDLATSHLGFRTILIAPAP